MKSSGKRRPPKGRGAAKRKGFRGRRARKRSHERGARTPRRPPRPPRAGRRLAEVDEIEVTVERLVAGGEGLARFEGIPVFVPRSAPGDRLRVQIRERRPDFGRAEILEVLAPGPGRRTPPCPHFERCGGCDLQHLDESHQLRWKAEAVRETLARLGGIEMPSRVTVTPGAPWGYRLRTQLHVGESERGPAGSATVVGYFARGSHDLVPVERCPVLVGELERQLPLLPRALAGQPHRRVDLAAGDGGAWTTAPVVPGLPHGEVVATVGEIVYGYDARCFFQGHRQLLPALVEHAVGGDEGELACDLYAGVGLFSLPLARRYRRVVAVEGDRVAARYARNNARHNKLANVEVEALAVDGWLRRPAARELEPSRVVVDPPRGGLSPALRGWLVRRRPPRLTYVSCHPAALARDLKVLLRAFALDSLALVDLFPQTGHMEVVAQLSAAEPSATEPSATGTPPAGASDSGSTTR